MKVENKIDINECDVFIEGEVVDLYAPSSSPEVLDQWFRWFNDPKVTTYLYQGVFPNSMEKQKKFYDSLVENDDRIALLIKPKRKDYFVGVASLSSINLKRRQCDFAIVIGQQDNSPDAMFYAMETKCRLTEHAFEKVGVERINSGQAIDLIKWQRWQILFGYQIEGILRRGLRKGCNVYDVMISSCLLEDYLRIKEMRNGSFWPGKKELFELMKMLPRESSIDRLVEWLKLENEQVWENTQFSLT